MGCLLGMAPLLFLGEKKELYFTKEEMALYESALTAVRSQSRQLLRDDLCGNQSSSALQFFSLAVGVRCCSLHSVGRVT